MPKARERFAEFLDQDSPDRLGMLYQTTSVGFGYGRHAPSHGGFSRQGGSPDSAQKGPTVAPRPHARRIACRTARTLGHGKPPPRPATSPRHPSAALLPPQPHETHARGKPKQPTARKPMHRKRSRTGRSRTGRRISAPSSIRLRLSASP